MVWISDWRQHACLRECLGKSYSPGQPARSGSRWARVAQIPHDRFAHFLPLRNRCDFEFARLLLGKGERRLFSLLGIRLAVHTVPVSR